MFDKLFERPPRSRTPKGMRIYAIGDIHGCASLLDQLLARIAAEEAADNVTAQLVFLGDYIDRGPDTRGVIERLLAVKADRPATVFLKGNHEDVFLAFLEDPAANADWLEWGGEELLASYGVRTTGAPQDIVRRLNENMPASHLEFLRSLELTRVIGDYLFVHAGIRPGVALDQQETRDLLWIRGEFHRAPEGLRPDKVVVHGHQPVKKAIDAGWRIGVDTGACFTGKLTAVALDGAARRFIST
ncbi:MAG: serine/threonine protein phosphatase [Parvularculaceae bacterium]|nr:serine/threonine protein phosphatase [Parvularculaceae bacterium]